MFSEDGKHPSVVGIFARQRGLQMPVVAWHRQRAVMPSTLVDRTSEMLPWSGDEGVQLISPVRARAVVTWSIFAASGIALTPAEPLSQQDVAITLPASFDEVARTINNSSRHRSWMRSIVLIEEPQAAFYAWLYRNRDACNRSCALGSPSWCAISWRNHRLYPDPGRRKLTGRNVPTKTPSQENSSAADQSQSRRVRIANHVRLHRVCGR